LSILTKSKLQILLSQRCKTPQMNHEVKIHTHQEAKEKIRTMSNTRWR